MIVKILLPSKTFIGVNYNTNKVEKDKGELMKVANFGALQALENQKPKDYVNYLEAQSARSSRIKNPQFHAVISAKGKSHSKEQLTEIAEQWLKGMGYGDNPYLLVFHKDTKNNHIHLISTRVGRDGKKIDDSYEKLRAYQVLNRIMGMDEKQQVNQDAAKALAYRFSTRAQFMMILEAQGYALQLSGSEYLVSKFGKQQATVNLSEVDAQAGLYQKNIDRLAQLRAIVGKYRLSHDPAIVPIHNPLPGGKPGKTTGYTSALSELLAEKFGIKVLFHGRDDKPPYGYTLIDHSQKTVYKGGDLMPLAEFIKPLTKPVPEGVQFEVETAVTPVEIDESFVPGYDTGRLTDKGIRQAEMPSGSGTAQSQSFISEHTTSWFPEISLDIADDIDDEAILGRNRQRKRQARTNTR